MTQLQPNIVVINRAYKNGCNAYSIGAHGIRKDLIAYQGAIPGLQTELCKAFLNALGKGLFCMRDAGNAIFLAEYLHPVFMAVGHHADLDI